MLYRQNYIPLTYRCKWPFFSTTIGCNLLQNIRKNALISAIFTFYTHSSMYMMESWHVNAMLIWPYHPFVPRQLLFLIIPLLLKTSRRTIQCKGNLKFLINRRQEGHMLELLTEIWLMSRISSLLGTHPQLPGSNSISRKCS